MNIAKLILPLSLSLLAAPVLAQEGNGSGKAHPNGMSYQDYENQRQKLLKHINPQQVPPAPERKAEPRGNSAYGQGYGSRKNAKDAAQNKPEKPARPEHPRVERPGRP